VGFLSPWFLAGFAAVGIPLWVHLLRRHRSEPLQFSSLMFFEQRTQSSIKHRRLRYLLLMAARIAVVVLLTLAFASPFVTRSVPPGEGTGSLLVMVLDRSFSMREGNRLAAAKTEAASLLNSWRPASYGQVLALDSQVHLLTQRTNSVDELRAAINSVEAGDGRSSFGELARALRSLSESEKLPLEVHLFSDMQRTSMPSGFADLALSSDTRLVLHNVGSEKPNWAVESVTAPRVVNDPKKVRILATVAGYATPAASRNVSLVVNGKTVSTKTVDVPENGRATVEFLTLDAPHGWNRAEVRIDSADTLPADDSFLFAVERSDPRRVLFVHEGRQRRGLLYYKAALESTADGAFQVEAVSADSVANVAPEKFAFTVISDVASLPPSFERALVQSIKSGGSAMIAIGPAAAARAMVPILESKIAQSKYAARSGERFLALGKADEAHPALQRTNRWENVKFYQAFDVDPGDARVVARLTDQTPILLEKRVGQGRVVVFTSTFDNISNDFPLRPAFVPFVERLARYLSGFEENSVGYAVGSYLELRREGSASRALEVLGPDGKRALSLSEAATTQNLQLTRPGYYEVRRENGRHELVAVNPDRRESDLRTIPEETLNLWQGAPQGESAAAATPNEPREERHNLAWYFLLALLAASVVESLIASRYLSTSKETA
jgi:N-terminal double-transmembrane domain